VKKRSKTLYLIPILFLLTFIFSCNSENSSNPLPIKNPDPVEYPNAFLTVSPENLSLTCTDNNQISELVNIQNPGAESFRYQCLTSNSNVILLNPGTGAVNENSSNEAIVIARCSRFNTGNHQETLTITAEDQNGNQVEGSPVIIKINIFKPALAVDTASVSLTCEDDNEVSQDIVIQNSSSTDFVYEGFTSDSDVTRITPDGGHLDPSSSITANVFALCSELSSGTYEETITIHGTDRHNDHVEGSPFIINIYISKTVLSVDTTSVSLTCEDDNEVSQDIVIQNSSSTDFVYEGFTSDSDVVRITPDGAHSDPYESITANIFALCSELSAGTYEETITITGTDRDYNHVDGSPIVIDVNITVE